MGHSDYVRIIIDNRINWNDRLAWLEAVGPFQDLTNWPAWSIGLTDIEVLVSPEIAVLYRLAWE